MLFARGRVVAIVVIVALAVLVVLGSGGAAGFLAGGTARAKLLQGLGELAPKCTPSTKLVADAHSSSVITRIIRDNGPRNVPICTHARRACVHIISLLC